MRVGVDVDGVLFDFVGSLRWAWSGQEGPTDQYPDPTSWEMWESWSMTEDEWVKATNDSIDRGLFRSGWAYPGALAGVRKLHEAGHEVHLITARDQERGGVDTAEWLSHHNVPYDSLTFNADKTCRKVEAFIEDNVDNARALRSCGTKSFIMYRPWNAFALECDIPFVFTWEDFVAEVEQLSFLVNEINTAAANSSRPQVRIFETGAMRDTDEGKLDYEGFLSPLALRRFAEYMHKNRKMADGSIRESDNWQRGWSQDVYMKSMFRHFMETWSAHRGVGDVPIEEALCGLFFNVQGYLHQLLKEQDDA